MKRKQQFKVPPQELLDMVVLDPNSPSYLSWKIKPKGHVGDDLTIRTKTTSNFSHVYYFCVWKKVQYFAHKIVYMLANNISPEGIRNEPIDHIDRNPFNNHPSNLRQASFAINRKNSNATAKSGYKGIYRCNRRGKYEIQLRKDHKCMTFGTKESLDEAIMTYIKAHQKLWPNENLSDEYLIWLSDSNNANKLSEFVLVDVSREATKYSSRKHITFVVKKNKWHSFYRTETDKIFLGAFNTEEEAIMAQDFAIKNGRRGSKEELSSLISSH